MELLAGLGFLVWVAIIGVPISLLVLAWCAYYRLKGMERALWAMVSQLRASRVEQQPGPLEVSEEGRHVSLSMFGR